MKPPNFRFIDNSSCYWCKYGEPQYSSGPYCFKYDDYMPDDKHGLPVCDDFEEIEEEVKE